MSIVSHQDCLWKGQIHFRSENGEVSSSRLRAGFLASTTKLINLNLLLFTMLFSSQISYFIWKFMFADFRVENSLKRLGLAVGIAPNILPNTHTYNFSPTFAAGLSENYDACFPSSPQRHVDETYRILSFEVN